MTLTAFLLAVAVIVTSAAGAGTTLIDAVKAGNRAAVRTLLTRSTVNSAEADGMTALHWAVRGDDLDTVQLLIATELSDELSTALREAGQSTIEAWRSKAGPEAAGILDAFAQR